MGVIKPSQLKGCPIVLIVIGLGIVMVAILLSVGGLKFIIKEILKTQIQIKNGSVMWGQWETIHFPAHLKIRIFNITNPEELTRGAKPMLVELGPYVYREKIWKENITIHELNGTVIYKQKRSYFFQPDLSNGNESDLVTIINIPFVTVAKIAHQITDADYHLHELDRMLTEKGEKLTRIESVRDLIWNGFGVKAYIDLVNDPFVQSAGDEPVSLPPQLADGRVGILKGRNNSDEGWMEVHSGRLNPLDFGRYATYNLSTSVSTWKGEPCNKVNGTDGIFFQPFIEPKTTVIQAFTPSLCRSLNFDADEKPVYFENIPAVRYRMSVKMFQSLEANPNNWCFCSINDTCDTNGLIDLGTCMGGAPIYLSYPHMMHVDEDIRNRVDGLNPTPELHAGYLDINAISGIQVDSKHRVQLNMKITRWDAMPTFRKVKDHFVPILWMEEGATAAGIAKYGLNFLSALLFVWPFFAFGLVVVGLAVFPGIAALIIMKRKRVKRIVSAESTTSSGLFPASIKTK